MTKEQFLLISDLHKQNSFVIVMSNLINKKNIYAKLYFSILLITFLDIFYEGVINSNLGYYLTWSLLLKCSFWIFCTLFPFIICEFIAAKINNQRIKKICKELNITLEEYNMYVLEYSSYNNI